MEVRNKMPSKCIAILFASCLPVIVSLFALVTASADQPQQPPNIVFILADDLGWQDVGFMGSNYFETPALDALAAKSLVFDNAFMYPTCSPSRAAILTGKQSFRTGCYTVPVLEKGTDRDNIFSRWTVGEEHAVFSKPLRDAGYHLIHLGKWHIVGPDPESEAKQEYPLSRKLGQPANGDLSWVAKHKTPAIQKFYPIGRGFHENVGGTWWGDPARGLKQGYKAPGGGYVSPFGNPFIEQHEGDQWLTDRLTDDAIDFMKRHKDGPFFVNLHYYAPHRPSVPRNEELLNHFLNKDGDKATGQAVGTKKKRKEIAAYATMVKSIDDNVKRISNFLDDAGLSENTVIVFTSDNGFNGLQSSNSNLRGAKGNVYDGGLRVPAFIHWPEKVTADRIDTNVQGLDLFPTFLELANVKDYAGTLDGDSLVPLMNGEPMGERPLFWHLASTYKDPPCTMIRRGKWKLIQFLKKGNVQLFDTAQDQKESRDLSGSYPEMTNKLLAEMVQWRKENNVPLPPSSSLED